MAQKGKNVALQINSNEELSDFMQQNRNNLLLLDVHNKFFGPCKSMASCLRKTKAETDILLLAIVDCDNIDVFRRFRGRSEPSWLFIFNGKVVNSFFGCNIPAMVQLTRSELKFYKNADVKMIRRKFELSEMTALEVEIRRAEKFGEILKKRADAEAMETKARQYIEYVIEKIAHHAAESGVTVFMPHVLSRHLYKKVLDIGENLHLTVREKKMARITSEHLKLINFEHEHLPQVLFEHINSKDVFMVCWKIPDNEERSVEDILNELKDAVTEKQTQKTRTHEPVNDLDESQEEENEDVGLALRSLSIILEQKCIEKCAETFVRLDSINVELIDDELEFIRYVIDFSMDYATNIGLGKGSFFKSRSRLGLVHMLNIHENDERFKVVMEMLNKLLDDVATDADADLREEVYSLASDASPTLSDEMEQFYDARDPKKYHIPPVWTPSDRKANAALIYLFFRVLTEHFLPPDPIPDPPHVAIAFQANKLAEVIDTAKPYGKDVLTFGYFDSSDWKKAKLLATSHLEYKKLQPMPTDRLVLKVREDSDVLLMLAALIPDYVSQNSSDGQIECERFFPDGYKNADEEKEVDDEEEMQEQSKQKE